MVILTDNIEYSREVLNRNPEWETIAVNAVPDPIRKLTAGLFDTDSLFVTEVDSDRLWQYMLVVRLAAESQYDTLIGMAQSDPLLPGGVLCLAGFGSGLHGFKNRPWVALPGNIHLCAFLAPQQKVDHFGVGFTILSAISVIEAVDSIEELKGRAAVKWVNDIVIDNAKVAGVLAHTLSQGEIVTGAILGIGLNVEATPQIERDSFVPRVAALRDFVSISDKCHQGLLLEHLIAALSRNYRLLLEGQYRRLLDIYRRRSLVIGREVAVYADTPAGPGQELADGIVTSIGENLELYLEGIDRPVTRGRLILKN